MNHTRKGIFYPYSIGQSSGAKAHLPAREAGILNPAVFPGEGNGLGNQLVSLCYHFQDPESQNLFSLH